MKVKVGEMINGQIQTTFQYIDIPHNVVNENAK